VVAESNALAFEPADNRRRSDRSRRTELGGNGRGIAHAAEGGIFLLYVDVYVVEFFVDMEDDTMHVDRVRRA
jgi:hypothetical protein